MRAADSEEELKAATVWLFVQYSQIPSTAEGAVTVGVIGRHSFAQALQRTLRGKTVRGYPVKVIEPQDDLRGCQILYFATDKGAEIRHALQEVQPQHFLSIGETSHFLEYGGAVNLFIVDGHIGFETNIDVLTRKAITISSNLLKFGQIRKLGSEGMK